MGKKQKLIKRLKSLPKDFTYKEMVTLLLYLDFVESNKGKTSGSRVQFIRRENGNEMTIQFHKPHPQKELNYLDTKAIMFKLREAGLI